MDLLIMWILYVLVSVVIFSGVLIWAVRSGQFRDQERARHLPLELPNGEERADGV